jgi:DNA-binding GntR family transcriptional regulator
MKAIKNPPNLKEAVYQRLKESIIRGEISPGSKLVETQISQKLGVSRTPLREAISRLGQEGLLEVIPRHGTFVRKQSVNEILETLEIREALEGLAARLAARHATPDIIQKMKDCFSGFSPKNVEESIKDYAQQNVRFHHLVIQASQNRRLIGIIRNLFDQMDMVRLHTIVLPGRAKKSLAEHREIIRLIDKKKGELAEKQLRLHIRDLRRAVRNYPNLGTPPSASFLRPEAGARQK